METYAGISRCSYQDWHRDGASVGSELDLTRSTLAEWRAMRPEWQEVFADFYARRGIDLCLAWFVWRFETEVMYGAFLGIDATALWNAVRQQ